MWGGEGGTYYAKIYGPNQGCVDRVHGGVTPLSVYRTARKLIMQSGFRCALGGLTKFQLAINSFIS